MRNQSQQVMTSKQVISANRIYLKIGGKEMKKRDRERIRKCRNVVVRERGMQLGRAKVKEQRKKE